MERHLYVTRQVRQRYSAITTVLTDRPDRLFADHLSRAAGTDGRLRYALRLDLAHFTIRRQVEIELGPLTALTPTVGRLPLSWRAGPRAGPFPRMDGHLEISMLGEHPPRCQLGFIGTYRALIGLPAGRGDRGSDHRIATQCVEHLLDDLATRFEGLALASPAVPEPALARS